MTSHRYKRGVAGALLLAAASGMGAFALTVRQRESIRPAKPPFVVDSQFAASRGVPLPGLVPVHQATVLLYVSETCSHCRAELARWSAWRKSAPSGHSEVAVVIVSAGERGPHLDEWLSALDARYIRDDSLRMARLLGVRAVPFAAYLSPPNRVRLIVIGESSVEGIGTSVQQLILGSRSTGVVQ